MSNKIVLVLLGTLFVFLKVQSGQARFLESVDSGLGQTESSNNPGWVRRNLVNFGEIASQVGNSLGSTGARAAAFVESLCKILKRIVPVVMGVCRIRQFQFCGSPDQPFTQSTNDAIIERNIELNSPF